MSLLGALTPLVKVAHDRKRWLEAASAYTAAGLVSAAGVGSALGWLGRACGARGWGEPALYGVAGLALLLAAREWDWISFPLPERRLQTEQYWYQAFGHRLGAAMWGLHLGLGFATRINYGGFWVLASTAFALASPGYGALLLAVYWLGRALPVWVAPALFSKPALEPERLLGSLLGDKTLYHRLQGAALAGSTILLVLLALAGPEGFWR